MRAFNKRFLSDCWKDELHRETCSKCGGPIPEELQFVNYRLCRSNCQGVYRKPLEKGNHWTEERTCSEEGCETAFTARHVKQIRCVPCQTKLNRARHTAWTKSGGPLG